MACLQILKQQIRTIESVFPKNHERFQIISASVDELNCIFVDKDGKKYEINASITETYPMTPPVWFAETDDFRILNVVKILSDTTGDDNHIIKQVEILLRELCRLNSIPEPADLERLKIISNSLPSEASTSKTVAEEVADEAPAKDESDVNTEDEASEHDDDLDDFEEEVNTEKIKTDEEMSSEGLAAWRRLQQIRMKYTSKNGSSGIIQATDRLMKELRDIYRSDSFKNKIYTIELVNDSLYRWNVGIKSTDPDSPLTKDLELLKKREGKDFILLQILFSDMFPFEPPFVRIVHPIMSGDFVTSGGALCMELLTKQGWSSAFTMEALIMQILATMLKGHARVWQFDETKSLSSSNNPNLRYTLYDAVLSFDSLEKKHQERGWHTPPNNEG
ncbi:ubiquitin-conjugating enzyme E2 Q2-like [Microplitis demolitor]|uniref:ubiquitin-conjugating enzyme E2 Q2-like n=1 Tax=Microplitis demolitor TaxID=69319 RepID=UPI00235B6A43|nr:ubiquitin-conjugating enzyme E2 Q2-like [Microplitis demolitor]